MDPETPPVEKHGSRSPCKEDQNKTKKEHKALVTSCLLVAGTTSSVAQLRVAVGCPLPFVTSQRARFWKTFLEKVQQSKSFH